MINLKQNLFQINEVGGVSELTLGGGPHRTEFYLRPSAWAGL